MLYDSDLARRKEMIRRGKERERDSPQPHIDIGGKDSKELGRDTDDEEWEWEDARLYRMLGNGPRGERSSRMEDILSVE